MLADSESSAPIAGLSVAAAVGKTGPDSALGEPSHLATLVAWLAGRKPFTIALACGYVAFVVLTHDLMQKPAYWAQGKLSHERWNSVVTGLGVPMLLAVCVWSVLKLRKNPRSGLGWFYLSATAILTAVSFRTLLVMNIEIVHFPQYAILAVLLFAIIRRYGEVMLWSTLVALVDEGYQYFVLYADRGIHFDFNDVILNAIGAGFGLVLLLIVGLSSGLAGTEARYSLVSLFRSAAFVVTSLVLLTCLALAWFGVLRLLPPEDTTLWTIVLRRGGPSTMFWTPTTWGKTFHEVQPIEWVFAAIGFFVFYAALDFIRMGTHRHSVGIRVLGG